MFQLENTFAEQLPGFYVKCAPRVAPNPALLHFNEQLADELGFDFDEIDPQRLAQVFSGNQLPEGTTPIAQAYAGHQFGSFAHQLGDGRALLLGEVVDRNGLRRDIAFKGSGRTPFSRGGDGKAAVGPVLREYLIGEAMHALGIPTTRALAAIATGETVVRETPLRGAVLTRVAASHIRVGSFEFFAARGQFDQVRLLADFVMDRHYPQLMSSSKPDAETYLKLLQTVADRQARLVAQWMAIGFIHGVMNTDNMTVSGETIDYGPCAFMEAFRPNAVFSSIDHGGRYAYQNQPFIARWNLARFAETLLPLIDENSPDNAATRAMEVLNEFFPMYQNYWLIEMQKKLGLPFSNEPAQADKLLIDDWLSLLERHSVDLTLASRRLADMLDGDAKPFHALFPSADAVQPWLNRWHSRIRANADPTERERSDRTSEASNWQDLASEMRAVNPVYIPRNHLVENALSAASDGDLQPFRELLEVITHPFEERPGLDEYAQPAPREFTKCYKTFCGT